MNFPGKEFKIYLIIYAILLVILASATSYIYHNIKTELPNMQEIEPKIQKEAMEFGKNKNIKNCVEESLVRITPCDIENLHCRLGNRLFLSHCLIAAKPVPGLCDEILAQKNNEKLKTSRWVSQTCQDHKEIHNIVCVDTLESLENYCEGKLIAR